MVRDKEETSAVQHDLLLHSLGDFLFNKTVSFILQFQCILQFGNVLILV